MEELSLNQWLERIVSGDDEARGEAWQSTGPLGAKAVAPLAKVFAAPNDNFEIPRSACRAIWQIVRHAGRPGADGERQAVVDELTALLGDDQPVALRREALWMLSELAGDEAVAPMARLLAHAELREDARACIERIPGEKALGALRGALATAPREFQLALAESLRRRGVEPGRENYPSQRLVPTKATSVATGAAK